MTLSRFMFAWLLSSVPYCMIAAYSGSISSLGNPKPALITAAVLTASLWVGWYFFRKTKLKRVENETNLV
ncbi:hypothetical protein BCU12_05005 [Vibrio sp. 10N.261.55.A7]|nr:hypothetical protein BCU12_05005 [Vibrio sp. 10N.261.55.A7]